MRYECDRNHRCAWCLPSFFFFFSHQLMNSHWCCKFFEEVYLIWKLILRLICLKFRVRDRSNTCSSTGAGILFSRGTLIITFAKLLSLLSEIHHVFKTVSHLRLFLQACSDASLDVRQQLITAHDTLRVGDALEGVESGKTPSCASLKLHVWGRMTVCVIHYKTAL